MLKDCKNIQELVSYLIANCDKEKQKYVSDLTDTHLALTVMRPIDFENMIKNVEIRIN